MSVSEPRPSVSTDTGLFGRDAWASIPGPSGRQQVEGYASTVSQAGIIPFYGRRPPRPVPDFRGRNGAATTREWWRSQSSADPDLVWLTAPVPSATDTTFTFAAASANLPHPLAPPNQATLYADDQRILTFELGQTANRVWSEGDWQLSFTPRLVHTPTDGYHRQFDASGCTGLYQLGAPATVLTPGQPLRLKVVLEPPQNDGPRWFAVLERPDVLEVNARTNAEQIAQLQEEVIALKQLVGNLARRNYPELFPDRLPTEELVIYTNGQAHVHPPDVEILQNGDLLVGFREASEHISGDGKIVTVRSTDGGRTWGDRQVVHAFPDTDFRDASITQLRDGSLLVNDFVNGYYDGTGRYLAVPSSTYQGQPEGIYVGRSTDNGRSWTWLTERPLDPAPFVWIGASERILELPSGELLLPVYFHMGKDGPSRRGCALYVSSDGGQTWAYRSIMADVPGVALGEPALTRTKTGRLLSVQRNETVSGFYHSFSDDDGHTWSPAVASGIPGRANPASLLPLPDGTVLCVYGSRHDTKGLYVVASYDDGATWDIANRRVIRDDFPNLDIGYPSTVLLPDGRILAVYYFNMFERYFIAGSLFRVPSAES